MANTTITKRALADALKQVMKTTPLSKVTIKNITDYCNISRNTFYYHFCDKYDLIRWIFYSEIRPAANVFSKSDKWFDALTNFCKYLYENRDFYLDVFEYTGQNSLTEYLSEFYFEILKDHLISKFNEIGCTLASDDLVVMARMETHAYIGMIIDWINSGMHDDYEVFLGKLNKINQMVRDKGFVPS